MNVRQVRKKIKSVGNVKKITNALEKVSAVKMKKAQQIAFDGKPYQECLDLVIRDLTQKIDPHFSVLLAIPQKPVKKELAIVISTNKGLCGSYNFNLFRFILKNTESEGTDYIILGKKATYFVNKLGGKIIADYSVGLAISHVSAIFQLVLDNFLKNNYQNIYIFYNKFISTFKSEPIKEVILPVKYSYKNKQEEKFTSEYLIEPSPKIVIDQLLRSYVEQKIRQAVIQAEAGEHSARMMAMKNATDSANDVIYNLTLLSNKLRQEKITNELLDMTTAKESVEN